MPLSMFDTITIQEESGFCERRCYLVRTQLLPNEHSSFLEPGVNIYFSGVPFFLAGTKSLIKQEYRTSSR